MRKNQTVSEMAQEVLNRQVTALAQRSGRSLEDARRAVSATEAGRQLRDLATGEHRHERAYYWRASVFWERAEQRFMHQIGSEALSRFAAERPYSWLESYVEAGRQGGASTLERARAEESRGKGAPKA